MAILHLKATDELRRVLENTDLYHEEQGGVIDVEADDPAETLATLREIVDVEES